MWSCLLVFINYNVLTENILNVYVVNYLLYSSVDTFSSWFLFYFSNIWEMTWWYWPFADIFVTYHWFSLQFKVFYSYFLFLLHLGLLYPHCTGLLSSLAETKAVSEYWKVCLMTFPQLFSQKIESGNEIWKHFRSVFFQNNSSDKYSFTNNY